MIDRRRADFVERLSWRVIWISALGAAYVLIDPQISVGWGNMAMRLGSAGFSADLKGSVITAILVGGFTGAIGYWLGASKSATESNQATARIAEKSSAVAASAVAASAQTPAAIVTENLAVASEHTTVNQKESP